jgi:hypothetical protein
VCSDLDILSSGKSTEVLRQDLGSKLFYTSIGEEWKKPVATHVTLCKFPLVTGSKESREFHSALYNCWDVKIFESAAIENFVKYKAGDAINYFYVYSLPYLLYMLFLIWINPQSVFTVSIFFCIQVVLLFLDIYHRGARVLAMAMQILDILRIISMGIICFYYYVLGRRAEIMTLATMFSFVNFLSWVSLIKYLRRMPGVRGYIPLLEASLKSLINFFVIILLFMVSFGTSIRIKALIMKQA